jgi:methylmalonyl-CoA mutase
VNILRTTTEAFSAVVGGCDSLHVTPYDCAIGQADDFSRRIARNQQIILLEESHLNAVQDPAGGSYYIEALTSEIIKKGWEYFLSLDDKGGLLSCLQDGSIQDKVYKTHQARVKNAETRKESIIGTSIFANLQEKTVENRGGTDKSVPYGEDRGGTDKSVPYGEHRGEL